jgi:hypothetical protein
VKVLSMLERREIPDDQFTMRRVQHPCRTPACLCGWANHRLGRARFSAARETWPDDILECHLRAALARHATAAPGPVRLRRARDRFRSMGRPRPRRPLRFATFSPRARRAGPKRSRDSAAFAAWPICASATVRIRTSGK